MVGSLCVIPARGGSKRIPSKNIYDYFGKPMIAWAIDAALAANIFDDVIVSTDDEQIAQISKSYGAKVPFLRNNYADDLSPVSQATIDCLNIYENITNRKYGMTVQLMPNCPNRRAKDILYVVTKHIENQHNFTISSTNYSFLNPWWARRKVDASWIPLFPSEIEKRSQDLPELQCPNGAIWVANSNNLKASGTFYGPDYQLVEIPLSSGVDIDDYGDLTLAKQLRKNGT